MNSEILSRFVDSYGEAALFFGAWLIVGLVLDQLVASLIKNYAKRHRSKIGFAFAKSFHGLISWMAGLIGFWIAFFRTPLPARINRDLSVYLKLATVVILTLFFARITSHLVRVYANREDTNLPASSIFVNLARALVLIIGFGIALAVLGISLTPIITALGVGGLAVGLALQPTLDNLFSGIQIIASKQIMPNDYVRLETGEEGIVEDVTWRNTTIRRGSGEVVIAPNSVLGKSLVINFSRNNQSYKLVIPTTVAFGSDPAKVELIALNIANRLMHASPDAYKADEPYVRFVQTDATGITFNTVLPIMSYNNQWLIKSQFIKELQKALDAEGIEGPKPLQSTGGSSSNAS